MFDYQKLGQDVKKYRKSNSLTRQEMADMMQISTTTLYNLECGKSVHLYHIRVALKIINKEILNYSKEPK